MSSIVINLISRVEADKNYFIDILFSLYQLRLEGTVVKLNIVGKIYNHAIHQTLLRFAECAEIQELVHFTNESIPFSILKDRKNEYFLNFSVGDFVGYSSIESVRNGLPTIFYNVDERYQKASSDMLIFNFNRVQFKSLLLDISLNKTSMRERILAENKRLEGNFLIDRDTSDKLLNLIST